MRNPPLLLDIREACSQLRISRTKFYSEMAAGRIETVTLGSRRLVPSAALEDYVDELRSQSA
jgi:excisionase family DNA binding protein